MTEPFPPTDGAGTTPPTPPTPPPGTWGPPGSPAGPYLPPAGPSGSAVPTEQGFPTTPMIPVQPPGQRRRSRGKTIGAVVGVTAMVAAGAFAVVSITGNDDAGGAASPSEVGTQLTAALDNEDLLGVIDLLLPGERDTFRDPLIRTVDNLKRLQVLSDDASLSGVSGIDIKFSDVQVREEPTNVDDIVNIFLSGTSSATIDGNEVPIGDLLLDEVFKGERPKIDDNSTSDEFQDVQMTVVQRDGRWYLSAFYSIAEQARGDAEIPAEGVAAAGADDPEGAVDQLLEAIGDQNLEDLIAVLDPTEAEALQRYAPLFLEDAQSAIDEAGLNWSIGDRTYSVEGSGGRRTVDIDSFTLTVDVPDGGGQVVVAYADKCLTVKIDGNETKTCGIGEGDLGDLTDELNLGDDPAITDAIDAFTRAFDDYDPSGLGVHEVDGTWYVSPLSTMFDALNDVLDALDRSEINDVIDAVRGLGDLADLPGVMEGGIDTSFPSSGDDSATSDTVTVDTVGDDTSTDDALSLCYQEIDAAAGVKCMQDGIAAGTIDPALVNPTFRFPECGAAEAYWNEVYSMSDADFVALATQASPCFLNLIASGQVEAYSVPSELIDPTCLEGKNWYTTFDSDYNDRFAACTAAAFDAL